MIRIPLKVKANLLTQEELVTIASGSSNSIKVKFDIDPNSDFADNTLTKRAIFRYYQGSYFISDVDANGEVYVPKFVIAYPYFKVALRAESENATAVVTTNEIQVPVEKSPVFYETTITDGDVTIRNLDGALNIYKAGDVTLIDFTASYKSAVDAVIAGTYATASALDLVASDVDLIKHDIINMSNSISDLQGDIEDLEARKQDTLVSGENIKTINGTSLLGSGNYDFDTALNEASTNSVQNKVIAKFANDVAGTYVTKIELYEALKRGEVSSEVEKVYTNEINYIAENVMPSGKVTKILGKTEKSENLLVLEDVAETTLNGITYSLTNGIFKLNGEPSDRFSQFYNRKLSIDKGTYYLKSFGSITNGNYSAKPRIRMFTSQSYRDIYDGIVEYDDSITQILFIFEFANLQGVSLSGSIAPMLVKGSTAPTTWSQGYTGLKHTHINGLKSTGINLWNEEWEVGGIDGITGQNAFASRIRSKNYIKVLSNMIYAFNNIDNIFQIYAYDSNYNYIGIVNRNNNLFTIPSNAYYIRFSTQTAYGTTYNHDICINLSDVAINGTYHPYEEETLNIDFEGNGVGNIRDELNVEEKKKYQRIGMVNLGTLSWSYQTINNLPTFSAQLVLAKPTTDNNSVSKVITSLYTSVSPSTNYIGGDKIISLAGVGSNFIWIKDSAYTDAQTFKTAMSGVYLIYELTTPIITDIEIENDGWLSNLIKDGSVTQLVDTTSLIAKEVDIAMNVVVDNQ